jgi:hypothetical protein
VYTHSVILLAIYQFIRFVFGSILQYIMFYNADLVYIELKHTSHNVLVRAIVSIVYLKFTIDTYQHIYAIFLVQAISTTV